MDYFLYDNGLRQERVKLLYNKIRFLLNVNSIYVLVRKRSCNTRYALIKFILPYFKEMLRLGGGGVGWGGVGVPNNFVKLP